MIAYALAAHVQHARDACTMFVSTTGAERVPKTLGPCFIARFTTTQVNQVKPAEPTLAPAWQSGAQPTGAPLLSGLPAISACRALAALFACLCTFTGWLTYFRSAAVLGATALLMGMIDGCVGGLGLAALAAYGGLCWHVRRFADGASSNIFFLWIQWLACAAFALNFMPGFRGPIFDTPLIVKTNAIGFAPGLCLCGALAAMMSMAASKQIWAHCWAKSLPWVIWRAALPAALVISALIPMAWAAGLVRFDPAVTPMILLFFVHNLLLVVIPEEILFRGMLPHVLGRSLPALAARPMALAFCVALIFGAGHLGGGAAFALLSFVAAIGYGWARDRAGGLGGSVVAHVALNMVHIVFFTYPAVQT